MTVVSELWVDRYRPRNLDEVLGMPGTIKKLRAWADAWAAGAPPQRRALLFYGDPGLGKTSAALALATEYAWDVVEMNASDQRNDHAVRDIAMRASQYDTFTATGEYRSSKDGKLKLVILDEADNLAGREDRGGVKAMAETIANTRQPIILIVNDRYKLTRRSTALSRLTDQHGFAAIRQPTLVKLLKRILKEEDISADQDAIDRIAARARGDARAAINDLQAWVEGGMDEPGLGTDTRKKTPSIYKVMEAIYYEGDPEVIRRLAWDANESPEDLLPWLVENHPTHTDTALELATGFEHLARAAQFISRTRRRQNYRYWAYASDAMIRGVPSVLEEGHRHAYEKIRFPTWLMKMSRSRGYRNTRKSLCQKLGVWTHTSWRRLWLDAYPEMELLLRADRQLLIHATAEARLEAEEVAFLLGLKKTDKQVKTVIQAAERMPSFTFAVESSIIEWVNPAAEVEEPKRKKGRRRKAQAEEVAEPAPEAEPESDPEPEPETETTVETTPPDDHPDQQKSLLDF